MATTDFGKAQEQFVKYAAARKQAIKDLKSGKKVKITTKEGTVIYRDTGKGSDKKQYVTESGMVVQEGDVVISGVVKPTNTPTPINQREEKAKASLTPEGKKPTYEELLKQKERSIEEGKRQQKERELRQSLPKNYASQEKTRKEIEREERLKTYTGMGEGFTKSPLSYPEERFSRGSNYEPPFGVKETKGFPYASGVIMREYPTGINLTTKTLSIGTSPYLPTLISGKSTTIKESGLLTEGIKQTSLTMGYPNTGLTYTTTIDKKTPSKTGELSMRYLPDITTNDKIIKYGNPLTLYTYATAPLLKRSKYTYWFGNYQEKVRDFTNKAVVSAYQDIRRNPVPNAALYSISAGAGAVISGTSKAVNYLTKSRPVLNYGLKFAGKTGLVVAGGYYAGQEGRRLYESTNKAETTGLIVKDIAVMSAGYTAGSKTINKISGKLSEYKPSVLSESGSAYQDTGFAVRKGSYKGEPINEKIQYRKNKANIITEYRDYNIYTNINDKKITQLIKKGNKLISKKSYDNNYDYFQKLTATTEKTYQGKPQIIKQEGLKLSGYAQEKTTLATIRSSNIQSVKRNKFSQTINQEILDYDMRIDARGVTVSSPYIMTEEVVNTLYKPATTVGKNIIVEPPIFVNKNIKPRKPTLTRSDTPIVNLEYIKSEKPPVWSTTTQINRIGRYNRLVRITKQRTPMGKKAQGTIQLTQSKQNNRYIKREVPKPDLTIKSNKITVLSSNMDYLNKALSSLRIKPKSKLFVIPQIKSGTKSMFTNKEMTRLSNNVKFDQFINQNRLVGVRGETITNQALSSRSMVNTQSSTKLKYDYVNRLGGGDYNFNKPIPDFVPDIPDIPPILLGGGGGGGDLKYKKIKRSNKQKKGYTPSLFSLALNIKGKATYEGIKTGLGIRPIIK